MSQQKVTRFAFVFSLIFFGVAILYLDSINKLTIYIHSSSQWFVAIAAFLFIILGLKNAFRMPPVSFEKSDVIGIFCLLLVALLIFIVKPTPLSVETAKTRISASGSPVNAKSAERFATRKTSDFSIVDWLAAFAKPAESYRYENTPATVSGFLLIKEGQPMVGRLVITCCGADAQPALIPFKWSQGLPPENTWIEVAGTMHSRDQKPFLEASSLKIIPEPSNPYAE
jgi:uncharacterized repeat protein (TIGR03943 family)